MSSSTRREFVQSSAAAAAGMTVLGALATAQADAAVSIAAGDKHAEGPIVAYVRDARKGEIAVMHGNRTIAVRDRQLAARLARAAG